MSDIVEPRVVAVHQKEDGAWRVFFNAPVPLPSWSPTVQGNRFFRNQPFDLNSYSYVRGEHPELPEDARYFWHAEDDENGTTYECDALDAYKWGVTIIEEYLRHVRA